MNRGRVAAHLHLNVKKRTALLARRRVMETLGRSFHPHDRLIFLLLSANSFQPAAAAHATLALHRQAPPQARSESTTMPDHKHSLGVRPHLLEVSTINYNPARLIPEMASGLRFARILTRLNAHPNTVKQHSNPSGQISNIRYIKIQFNVPTCLIPTLEVVIRFKIDS